MEERKWTWVVPSCTPEYLELFLDYLPDEPWPWVRRLVLILPDPFDDRWNGVGCRLLDMPGWEELTQTYADDTFFNHPPATGDTAPGMRAYAERWPGLAIKVLAPLYFAGPLLIQDDDTVVLRDPAPLLELQPWGSTSGLDKFKPAAADAVLVREWDIAFGGRVSARHPHAFNSLRVDAAVTAFNPDRALYRDRVTKWFGWATADAVRGKAVGRSRLMDQRFLSYWMIAESDGPLRGPGYRAMPTKKMQRSLPRHATFIHYCASGVKQQYVDWLRSCLASRAAS